MVRIILIKFQGLPYEQGLGREIILTLVSFKSFDSFPGQAIDVSSQDLWLKIICLKTKYSGKITCL